MISVINDITTVFVATITTTIGVIITRLVTLVTDSKSGFALLNVTDRQNQQNSFNLGTNIKSIKISRIGIKMFASANLGTN